MKEENSILEIPLSEKLKGIPGIFGIRLGQGPLYDVICTEGDKEIRKYPPFILASITLSGSFEEVKREAFICLANYIYGQNKDNKHLKMTTPVLQNETHDSIPMTSSAEMGWTMSFVLPPKYNLASAPTPRDSRILLHKNPERLVASLRYSGVNDEIKIKKYSLDLIQWISKSDLYVPEGDVQIAQYDGPTTIAFLRRNEVHIEVKHLN